MLILDSEKELCISSQVQYDIINKALEMANDSGFLNQFVFERALWILLAQELIEDIDEEILNLINENPIQAWDKMLEENIIDELINNYKADLDYFAAIAAQYFEDYKKYLLSIGGALGQMDMLSTNNLNNFTESLQDFLQSDNTLKTLELADEWGMHNKKEN